MRNFRCSIFLLKGTGEEKCLEPSVIDVSTDSGELKAATVNLRHTLSKIEFMT